MTRKTLKLALASLLLTPALALASVPGTIAFSARIADNGRPLTGAHNFTFKLFNDPAAGAEQWKWSATDTPAALTVNDGVVTYALGSENALAPTLFTGAISLFLEVTMDGQTMSPRIAIQSVPFAFRAAQADNMARAKSTQGTSGISIGGAGTGCSAYTTVASTSATFPAAGVAIVTFDAEPYTCGNTSNCWRILVNGTTQRFGYFENSATGGYPHPISRTFVMAVNAGTYTFNGDLAPNVACLSYSNEMTVLYVPSAL